MSGLSIDEIKFKANQARDLYKSYIDNLVQAGETRKARDNEIDLFNLEKYYRDNKITAVEALEIKNLIDSIDIESLADNKDIIYNTAEKKLSMVRSAIDINGDGKNDLKDLAGMSYVINFKGDSLTALENTLDIVGNQDKITEFYINQWAKERGMVTGSEKYNVFYNKFYNDLYKNANPKGDLNLLQKILRFYDAGIGKEKINEIDKFLPAIKADSTFGVIMNLYKFANSEHFNIPEEQKQEKLTSYFKILNGSNDDVKRIFAEAMTRNKTPVTGKPLTVSNLDYVLDIYQIPKKEERDKKLNLIMFNQWADKRNLVNEKREAFISKLLLYTEKNGLSLSTSQLKPLTDIYDTENKLPSSNFNINSLDIYAEAVKNNIPPRSLSLIYRFEKSESFNLVEPARSAKLGEYFEILKSSNSEIKTYLLQALNTGKIPFSEEPVNLNTLDSFIRKISQTDGIIDAVINNWAKERNISGSEKTTFFNKLKEYHTKKITQTQMKTLLGFFDEAKRKNKNFPINNLDVYVKGMQREIEPKQLDRLFKFETSNNFSLTGAQRDNEIENLMGILAGGDKSQKAKRKQEILQKTLSNGRKVSMSNEDISLENIKKVFNRVDDETNFGYENLQIESLAIERNLTSPEKEIFISKLKEWHLPQSDSTKNLQLKIGSVMSLVKLYDEKKLAIADLDIYAKAIKEGISFEELNVIYKFEAKNDIKNKNNNRNEKIESYIRILKSNNEGKIRAMLGSMRSGKIPITQKAMREPNEAFIREENFNEFNSILAKYDNEREIVSTYIRTWATDPKFPGNFEAKFMSYYNDNEFKLSLADLTALKKIYENNTNFALNKLDIYAKGIKAKNNLKDLTSLFKIHSDSRFNGSNEQISKFIEILTIGSNNEKYVLKQVFKNNNIPYINKKFFTENTSNLNDLLNVLQLVKNESELNRFSINKWAKEMQLNEGTSEYNQFMQKFFNEYLTINKIPMNDLNVLKNIYQNKKYSYTKMDTMVSALKKGLGIHDLKRLDQFSERMNFSETQFTKYLNILLGKEGEDKKRVILEMIRTQNIPFSNIRI
jgi:hypothetical protein